VNGVHFLLLVFRVHAESQVYFVAESYCCCAMSVFRLESSPQARNNHGCLYFNETCMYRRAWRMEGASWLVVTWRSPGSRSFWKTKGRLTKVKTGSRKLYWPQMVDTLHVAAKHFIWNRISFA